ncbi:hypothetical protein [Streptomyces sp. NPDC002054]
MARDKAVLLVQHLMDGTTTEEAEADAALTTLQLALRCPHLVDYIF